VLAEQLFVSNFRGRVGVIESEDGGFASLDRLKIGLAPGSVTVVN
jgi:hypothetical protein